MNKKLADVLVELNWSDMDEFCEKVLSACLDDKGKPNDERYVALVLLEAAHLSISS